MPDIKLALISLAIAIGVAIVVGVPIYLFVKRHINSRKEKSKFNLIKIGMKESDLYAQFGTPQKTLSVDSSSKVVTFIDKKWGLFFVDTIVAQVSIKDGIVTNLDISA